MHDLAHKLTEIQTTIKSVGITAIFIHDKIQVHCSKLVFDAIKAKTTSVDRGCGIYPYTLTKTIDGVEFFRVADESEKVTAELRNLEL